MRFAVALIAAIGVFAASFSQVSWRSLSSAKKGVWTAKVLYPVFGDGSQVETKANEVFALQAHTFYAEFMDAAQHNPQRWAYELDVKPTVSIAKPNLISGYNVQFIFTGGAHPNTNYLTHTIGVVDGKAKELTFSDVLVKGANDKLSKLIIRRLNEGKSAKGMELVDTIDAALYDSFVVTPAGMTWIFGPYAVGAYVEGAYFVKCTWAELSGMIDTRGALAPAMVPVPQTEVNLVGSDWYLAAVDGKAVLLMEGRQAPRISFNDKGEYGGNTGVNVFGGKFTRDGDSIACQAGMMSKQAGTLPMMKQEQALLNALESARSYRIKDNVLELLSGEGKLLAKFERR